MEEGPCLEGASRALKSLGGAAAPIAIMDSGVGGLPYLASARQVLSAERYVYLADRAGFPYGTKTRAEIESITLDRVRRLIEAFAPKAVVIACNTASQASLAAVRDRFPGTPIVGTVPAVKPAAAKTASGVIGVMATEHALVDPYLDELISTFAAGSRVLREPAQDLVAFVEHRLVHASAAERRAAVQAHVKRLVDAGADEIVLACTHFLHIAEDIELAARDLALDRAGGSGAAVHVVDSRDGVAHRLRDVLAEAGLLAVGPGAAAPPDAGGGRRDGVFILSGPPPFEEVYSAFAERFGLLGPFSLDKA